MKKRFAIPAVLGMLILCGCGRHGGEVAVTGIEPAAGSVDNGGRTDHSTGNLQEQGFGTSALSLSAEAFYTEQTPGILVDENGYDASAGKIAILCGDVLPASFEVREDATDAVVYTGEVRRMNAQDEGLQVAVADFSDVKESGTYYLSTQWLGESRVFDVLEDRDGTLMKELLGRYYINRCGIALTEEYAGEHAHGVCHSGDAHLAEDPDKALDVSGGWHMDEHADRFSANGAQIVTNLLLAYEMNQAAFGDDTGIPESGNGDPDVLDECRIEIEWLMKMQDPRTGGIYAAALTTGAAGGNLSNAPVEVQPATPEATIHAAAALAKFGYLYRRSDPELAKSALRAADKAFTFYLHTTDTSDAAAYLAAAELYRATGREEYAQVLEGFFESDGFYERAAGDEDLFMGSVTYLMTGQNVRVGVSNRLMNTLMREAETYATNAKRSAFEGETDNEDDTETVQRLLHGMQLLAVCDHVSYSYEYTTLLSDQLHLLGGRNAGAQDYLSGFAGKTGKEDYPGIVNQPVENAALTVALAMIMQGGE